MNKALERLRHDFQGNADELILKAQALAKVLALGHDASEGNERLLRHYVSLGVVDKPSREGRDALYGFRHLVQFVAARRLLAEGFPLAKIARYTAVVTTDALTAYLEKPDRASEAELLVAAFRSEAPVGLAPAPVSRRSAAPKSLPGMATGMGMVDVMHEMREMELRVNDMLQKPMRLIEKQMDQQRFLFEEAVRQKDFLERMFGKVLDEQRQALLQSLDDRARRLDAHLELQRGFYAELSARLDGFETEMAGRLSAVEKEIRRLSVPSRSTRKKKEGAA